MSVTLNVCQGSTILMSSAHNISIKVLIYRANEKQHSKVKHRVKDARNFALSKIRQGSHKFLLQNVFLWIFKIRRLCKLLVMADKQSQPLSPWRRAPKTVMQKKSYICYISNFVKIEFNHMKSKVSEKWCLFVSLSKLIPNPTPSTFFNQICPKLKQGSRRIDSTRSTFGTF